MLRRISMSTFNSFGIKIIGAFFIVPILALSVFGQNTGTISGTVTDSNGGLIAGASVTLISDQIGSSRSAVSNTEGRDFTSLLRLLPGTSNNDDIEAVGEGFGTDLPNISGQRGRTTTTSIDGLTASEPSGSNKVSMSVNQDAVGEVQVLRNNYSAEYGNNGGAIINVVTKGGGKDYRGTAYYF